jgi:hypothetical protein
MLKYNKLFLHLKDSSTTLRIATGQQFGPIGYLVIDHSCTLNELVRLISYSPQFCHLIVYKTDQNDSNVQIFSLLNLSHSKSIYLDMYQIKFNELEIFSTKIFSNLKSHQLIV